VRAVGVLLCVAALGWSGCGAGENEGLPLRASEDDTLRFAFWTEGAEAGEEIPTRCDGAIDYARDRGRMTCFARTGRIERVWIASEWFEHTADRGWSIHRTESAEPFIGPRELLELLRDATLSSERFGPEAVRGVAATRHRLVVDAERADLESDGETAQVDVWVDAGDVLRRARMPEDGGVLTIEYFAFGEPVEIEPPAEVDALDELLDSQSCPEVPTAPLEPDDVFAAFHAHGLEAGVTGPGCEGTSVALWFVEQGEEPDRGLRTEFVDCELSAEPPVGPVARLRPVASTPGEHALALANVECTLSAFPEGAVSTDARRRFELAYDDLRRSLVGG
jgi:hypothetical protein